MRVTAFLTFERWTSGQHHILVTSGMVLLLSWVVCIEWYVLSGYVLSGCIERVYWEGILPLKDELAANITYLLQMVWYGRVIVMRGYIERMYWEDVLRGYIEWVCWEGILRGCIERVYWEGISRGYITFKRWTSGQHHILVTVQNVFIPWAQPGYLRVVTYTFPRVS